MSSKTPTVKQIAWISLVPQLLFMGLLMFIGYQINPRDGIIYGAIVYLVISYVLRMLIPQDHKNGMSKIKANHFKTAIADFEKSYAFFKKYEWIDKYRYLTLLSSSRISYREMALNNIAFCYGQLGNGKKCRVYYEKTLAEFPDSELAKVGLRLLDAALKSK